MSDRHRRGGGNNVPATSHVGGNNNNGGGGGGGNRNSRRMLPTAPATAHVNPAAQMMPPQQQQQWPGAVPQHHTHTAAIAYANTDFMYRFGQNGAVMTHVPPQEMFPPTPYMPAADVVMSRQIQRRFMPPPEAREKTIVNSPAFMQFPVIYNVDSKPVASSVPCMSFVETQVFTTSNKYNDAHVLLRRIVGSWLNTPHAQAVFDKFRHFRHPSLVKVNSMTHTTEFVLGSNDVIVEYKFIKNARSLREVFLQGPTRRDVPRAVETLAATEGQLWSFAVQLIGLIRSFHELKQPIRGLHWSKLIYIEETNRIMFTGLGLVDLTCGFSQSPLEVQFSEDIQSIGEVLLNLVTGTTERVNPKEDGFWERYPHCSEAIQKLITMCYSAPTSNNNNNTNNNNTSNNNNSAAAAAASPAITIQDICTLIASRISIEVGHQQGHADYLLHECSKAQENGRMMRLMMRLNLIMACEEHQPDSSDRYVLRLFHQYVFHQVDDNGRARLDWGHIYHCLNKLDCGSDEIIQMVSNEHDLIVVASFEDIKALLESAFRELEEDSHRGPMDPSSVPTSAASLMAGTPVSMMMMGSPAGVGGTPSSLAQPSMRYSTMGFH